MSACNKRCYACAAVILNSKWNWCPFCRYELRLEIRSEEDWWENYKIRKFFANED